MSRKAVNKDGIHSVTVENQKLAVLAYWFDSLNKINPEYQY
jgi:hypothetical protein